MSSSYEEYYHNIAPIFNQIRLDRTVEITTTVEIIQKFVRLDRNSILDIGCGTARYARCLKGQGYNILGLDISLDQLLQAKRVIPVVCASAASIPFLDGHFACGMMIQLLHQLNPEIRKQALSEAFRILDTNGILVIKTRSHNDIYRYPFRQAFPSAIPVNLRRYPAISLLLSDLETAGFNVISITETFSEQPVERQDLLHSIKNKYNSTLALIPSDEFELGYEKLVSSLEHTDVFPVPHYHTIIVAMKGGVTVP